MTTTRQETGWSHLFATRMTAGGSDEIARIMAQSTARDVITFSGGFPDPATFPGPVVARLMAEIVEEGDPAAFQYAPTAGLETTRAFLADRLAAREGARPADDALMVTSGSIEALELVSKCLLDPDDVAAVEAPTYLGALMAFRGYRARTFTVDLDADGMLVDTLADALAHGIRPKLVYTIPDHHNPAGVSLSFERREALVELARHYGFLVVEDVAYRELGFGDQGPPSLWSLAPDVVMQAGTFSKTFFPGVRLGWAAAPPEIVSGLVVAKQNTDQCAGALGQRLLEKYGRAGLLDEQIDRSRALYGRRCSLLMEALDRHLPGTASWTRPRGGFFSWLTLPTGVESVALGEKAAAVGVTYVAGVPFFPDGRGHDSVRLSFSRVGDGDIDEGIRRLASLLPGNPGAAT